MCWLLSFWFVFFTYWPWPFQRLSLWLIDIYQMEKLCWYQSPGSFQILDSPWKQKAVEGKRRQKKGTQGNGRQRRAIEGNRREQGRKDEFAFRWCNWFSIKLSLWPPGWASKCLLASFSLFWMYLTLLQDWEIVNIKRKKYNSWLFFKYPYFFKIKW